MRNAELCWRLASLRSAAIGHGVTPSEENGGVNSMEFEVVAEGLKFPEGPVAMPDGSVIFVELLAGKLNRAWGNGKIEVIADLGGSPAGAAIGPDGAIYIANVGGVHREKFL